MSKPISYDVVFGPSGNFGPSLPFAASQVFKAQSGRFVSFDASAGHCTSAANGANEIIGSTPSACTTSSTAGGSKLPVDMDLEKIHEVPVYHAAGDFTADYFRKNYLFKTCDLYVSASVQYANLDASDDDVLYIVGYDVDHQTAFVKLNPKELGQSGV